MRYIFGFILAIGLTGCAITWTGVALAIGSSAAILEDVGGIVKTYKDTKDYILDTNTTEDK